MNTIVFVEASCIVERNVNSGYIFGVIISLLIMGYLLYSLVKPEKF